MNALVPSVAPACSAVLERLSDYLDGELSFEERSAVEQHLVSCRRCEQFGGELSELLLRLRTEICAQTPPLSSRVLVALRDHVHSKEQRST